MWPSVGDRRRQIAIVVDPYPFFGFADLTGTSLWQHSVNWRHADNKPHGVAARRWDHCFSQRLDGFVSSTGSVQPVLGPCRFSAVPCRPRVLP